MIDLHEGRIPFYQAQTAEDIEEAKRLFYVGVTRAKRFLLYVTDDFRPSQRTVAIPVRRNRRRRVLAANEREAGARSLSQLVKKR